MRISDWSSDVCSSDLLPTTALLDFQAAHGRARDAVHGAADFASLADALAPQAVIAVHSQASDRATYLRRPDLGRRLDPAGLPLLEAARGDWDVAFVIADGLSARAVSHHSVPQLQASPGDRKSVVSGTRGQLQEDTGGRRITKKK